MHPPRKRASGESPSWVRVPPSPQRHSRQTSRRGMPVRQDVTEAPSVTSQSVSEDPHPCTWRFQPTDGDGSGLENRLGNQPRRSSTLLASATRSALSGQRRRFDSGFTLDVEAVRQRQSRLASTGHRVSRWLVDVRRGATVEARCDGRAGVRPGTGYAGTSSMPVWWNGRRAGFRNQCPRGREGSSPSAGTATTRQGSRIEGS